VTAPDPGIAGPDPDPTFPPSAYERLSLLLRGGVVGFLILASAGLIAHLVAHPTETVASLLAPTSTSGFPALGALFSGGLAGSPEALIILGIYVMIAVTIGRVLLATVEFYRGGERALGTVSAAVVALLTVGLVIVAPFVH
jgi:uncharacterized membrane protein